MKKNINPGGNRVIRGVFVTLALILFISIIIQVFMAGIAIFADFGKWGLHKSFIHYFEFIPLLMLLLSFFGRIPKILRWQCVGLYFMIILQYVTVQLSGNVPYLAALHPVIGLLLFWRSLVMARESLKIFNIGK